MSSGTKQKTQQDEEPAGGRMDRISDHTKGLVDDVKEWVDLRMRLFQLDVEERINTVANQAVSTIVVLLISIATALFLLLAAAFGLGMLLGNNAYGFLAIGLLLGIVTLVINRWRPRFVKADIANAGRGADNARKKKKLAEKKPDADSSMNLLPAPHSNNEGTQDKNA